jgi:hypothetical protein
MLIFHIILTNVINTINFNHGSNSIDCIHCNLWLNNLKNVTNGKTS